MITAVQNAKRNREECIQLLENIPLVLFAIVNLYAKSEVVGSLPPSTLDHIGKFMETLHKIYAYIEAQQDGNKFKQLFRNGEMNVLLKDCRAGLAQGLEVFGINSTATPLNNIEGMKKMAEIQQQEMLELISTLSDASTISDGTSLYLGAHETNSSNSFSLLPSQPKIFHGRELEIGDIMKILAGDSPRIAILGGGGMGKTTLAKAALHHPETSRKFDHRFFISAESATNSIELAALTGLHLGLNPGPDLTKPVAQYFAGQPPCLVILDNLETSWDPIGSRADVEELLSLLTDIPHLGLIITMRGAERPGRVHWTRPFLLPLQRLSDEAAEQTFVDITDNFYDREDIKQLLDFTDNMPLAVDLMAHLADYEGCSNVLARWKAEKTSLLSVGYDRKSNLDVSISLSLSSPRITPDSKELLSLLSILPDGLSEVEILQSNLPVQNILKCRTTLLATSLAYLDERRRLRSLLPVREHIRHFLPPSPSVVQSLRQHFHSLLELYKNFEGEQLTPIVSQIVPNLGNLQEVLQQGLHDEDPSLVDTIQCILSLNSFYRVTGRDSTMLMDCIPPVFPQPVDRPLETMFLTEMLLSRRPHPTLGFEQLLSQAVTHLQHFDDPTLESRFHWAAGVHFTNYEMDPTRAMQSLDRALKLSKSCGDLSGQCNALIGIAQLKWNGTDYSTALVHAREAQRLAQLSAFLYQEARARWIEALCFQCLGDYRETMAQLDVASDILGLCGLSGGSLDYPITMTRAEVHLLKSEYSQAQSIYAQGAHAPNTQHYAYTELNIAEIGVLIGTTAKDVRRRIDNARTVFNGLDSKAEIVLCNMILADLELREGNMSSARTLFRNCLDFSWGLFSEITAYCLERLADISRWSETGFHWPVIYLAYSQKSKAKLPLHKALLFLGDVFLANQDDRSARSLFTAALDGFTFMDIHRSRAQCMLRLGDLANTRGDISEALELWKAAGPLFEQSFQDKDVARINSRLTGIEQAVQEQKEVIWKNAEELVLSVTV
ncbi:ATPase-AAA-core domain-containing protein [Mycena venus]|uniref:ATPase-AAA-core domain-containing protein n=1 Tax=Mycena venus TaxID=2733690 RepID=A0A8H7CF57_9AGAR|nr:ATPase-AAA-core domain-containing protein [Mycena venus]